MHSNYGIKDSSMSNQLKAIIAVPARLKSSRLPNKVLADIDGKPMLQHVLERCALAKKPIATILCTDSDELINMASSLQFDALKTNESCKSGSERIASVCNDLLKIALKKNNSISNLSNAIKLKDLLIINVQGDQPFIDPKVIDKMVDEFSKKLPSSEVMTPIYELSPIKIHNPNIVKTLVSYNGRAIYFSRSALPHVRGYSLDEWHNHSKYWGHVGIYGYRGDILNNWNQLPFSPLEEAEKLEQLRLIEAGFNIDTFTVQGESLSVDTFEQLEQAREIAASRK